MELVPFVKLKLDRFGHLNVGIFLFFHMGDHPLCYYSFDSNKKTQEIYRGIWILKNAQEDQLDVLHDLYHAIVLCLTMLCCFFIHSPDSLVDASLKADEAVEILCNAGIFEILVDIISSNPSTQTCVCLLFRQSFSSSALPISTYYANLFSYTEFLFRIWPHFSDVSFPSISL